MLLQCRFLIGPNKSRARDDSVDSHDPNRPRFYRSDTGREPVREWLKALHLDDRKVIGEDIKDVEFSWPIGMPLVRSLGKELWEVRSSLPRGRIARIVFCVEQESMVLLHGFMKK